MDTEHIYAVRLIPTREDLREEHVEMMDHFEQWINRELWTELRDKASDGGEYIIKIAPKEIVPAEYPDCMKIKGCAEITPLVRCKDCAWKLYEQPGMVYCPHVYASWVPEDFYCGAGVRDK